MTAANGHQLLAPGTVQVGAELHAAPNVALQGKRRGLVADMFEVMCECGNSIPVRAGQAGGTVACRCGRQVSVPQLSHLRRAAEESGRSTKPRPAQHDWTAWWWGVGLVVVGELAQLAGLFAYGSGAVESQAAAFGAFAAIVIGYVLVLVGIFAVGLGKGFALWFCLLLFFCIPFGRLVILFIPGKGADKTP